jgi:hypothetical protein
MNSNWELTKARSQYHFDKEKWNPKWDRVERVGTIPVTWQNDLSEVLQSAQPVTWRTRGRDNDPLKRQDADYDQEDYDLEQQGYGKDYVITNLTYKLPQIFQSITDQFCLEKCMARVHVQQPGQVWNLHLDKLEKWMPEDPTQVVRYFIQLTDWQQGHFWSFGNYTWWGWNAGDITTFDWLNVPHSTANAGHTARATLQITGIKTNKTEEFLQSLG